RVAWRSTGVLREAGRGDGEGRETGERKKTGKPQVQLAIHVVLEALHRTPLGPGNLSSGAQALRSRAAIDKFLCTCCHDAVLYTVPDSLRAYPSDGGSLANERALLDLLDGDHSILQPTSLKLAPLNSNIYARRHSAHICPVTEEKQVMLQTL
ncbi:hypothetical protein NQ318_020676, partial [Aromia moschata]